MYLDDIIILSDSVKDHIEHLDEVLTYLGLAGISLKLRPRRNRICHAKVRRINLRPHQSYSA